MTRPSRLWTGTLLWLGVPVLLGVAIVVAAVVARPEDPQTIAIEGVQEYPGLPQGHTTEPVDYPQTPPVGGEHDPVWAACDGVVTTDAVAPGNGAHSLEHGAVWVSYQPGTDQQVLDALAERVEGAPYTFMSPVEGQPDQVMLTAWGAQVSIDGPDDPRVDQFLAKYRQGPQTPEPGATCSVA